MTYFVTGATGFIGRHLVEELLARTSDIHVLVREGSQARLNDLVADWELSHPGATERIKAVVGDLRHERLVDPDWLHAHTGQIDHLFHLAAIYDMAAGDEVNERMNVAGTRNAVALANALHAGCLHHVSSIAVAGDYKGLFREDMFAKGQKLPSAYHRTKYEAEALVRSDAAVPWRVYRPAVVVGHSETGEMDKIDGPYYFFTAIQKLRDALPPWVPLVGPELGWTNLVPVDYVARAMAHIATSPTWTARPSTSPTHALGRGPQRLRGRRARAADGAAHRQEAHRRAAQGRGLAAAPPSPAQGRARRGPRCARHPGRGDRACRLPSEVTRRASARRRR